MACEILKWNQSVMFGDVLIHEEKPMVSSIG
jgi:hypothetical protein